MVNERKMERTYDRGNERMNIQSDGGIIWNERKEGRIYAKRGGKWIKRWGEQGTKGIVKCTSFFSVRSSWKICKRADIKNDKGIITAPCIIPAP